MPIYGNEQDYEGQDDAKTLDKAHAIRKDSKRHKVALGHLKKMGKKSSHSMDAHKFEGSAAEEASESKQQEAVED